MEDTTSPLIPEEKQVEIKTEDPGKIIWYNSVIMLEDGSCACEQHETEAKCVDHIHFVVKKCEENNIKIIQCFSAPSDDPEWIPKFQNAHKEKILIAKQKLLDMTLAGKKYGKRLRTINYQKPEEKTNTFFTGPPSNFNGARVVTVQPTKQAKFSETL